MGAFLDFMTGGGASMANGVMSLIGNTITNYKRQRLSQQKLNKWNFENITKPQMAIEQEYNEKNMALQNQYSIDAENRANAYNDPSAQRARLQAAGLSPYQGGADAGVQGSISSAPSSDSPSGSLAGGSAGTKDYSGLARLDILGMMQSIKKFSQDLKIQREQQDNNNRVADADIDLKKAEADRLRGQENRDSDVFSALKRSAMANADSAEARASIDKIDLEIREATKENDIERAEVSLEKMRADKKISDVTYNLYKAQIDNIKARTKTEGTQQELNKAKAKTEGTQQELNKAKADTEEEQQDYLVAQTEKAWSEWNEKEINNEILAFRNSVKGIDWTHDKIMDILDKYLEWKGLSVKEREAERKNNFATLTSIGTIISALARFKK